MFRPDPGLCLVCDAPHCSCTPGGADSVVILSQRDAMQATAQSVEPPVELVQPVEVVEPEPAPFTTSNYTRREHGLKRPRRAPPPNRGADR
jgi:hypothetical protein